jgi:hypothetical protein
MSEQVENTETYKPYKNLGCNCGCGKHCGIGCMTDGCDCNECLCHECKQEYEKRGHN